MHRYWRININSLPNIPGGSDGGAPFCAYLNLVEMSATNGGINLIGSGVATASENSESAINAATGDGWSSVDYTLPLWWQYDFGSPVDVAQLTIQSGTNAYGLTGPDNFNVAYSDNNIDWTVSTTFPALQWHWGEQQIFNLPIISVPTVLEMTNLVCICEGSGDTSHISLVWSDTKGASWSNPVERSTGASGEYDVDISWRRLGMSRDRVFTLQWEGGATLTGAFILFEIGNT